MIIWNGMGFLVVVFVFGCSLAANLITNHFAGEEYWDRNQCTFGVSLLVSSFLSWIVGGYLARGRARTLVDTDTGEEVVIAPDHSLFFIKMHWWGPILLVAGVVFIAKDLMQ